MTFSNYLFMEIFIIVGTKLLSNYFFRKSLEHMNDVDFDYSKESFLRKHKEKYSTK